MEAENEGIQPTEQGNSGMPTIGQSDSLADSWEQLPPDESGIRRFPKSLWLNEFGWVAFVARPPSNTAHPYTVTVRAHETEKNP